MKFDIVFFQKMSRKFEFHSVLTRIKGTLYKGYIIYRVKGKAIPLQAWTDPKGSRRLRLPDFKTIRT